MTTKLKASLYRLKPGGPLAAGVDADAIARAAARQVPEVPATDGTAALKEEVDPPAPKVTVSVERGKKSAEAAPVPPGPGLTGEVTTAGEMDSETAIEAIRKEGLTGRQLRMARRVAMKHSLAPTSDFDAVRLLRAKGIDPFSRANVLELVPGGPGTGTSMAMTAGASANLPQTASRAAPPPALSEPAPAKVTPNPADDRANEILRIQQDIARRRRRRMSFLAARLGFFVLLPTLLTGLYYTFIATPMYATKSEFVIQQADAPAAGGAAGLFAGTGLAAQLDSTQVQSYLQSRDAMRRLNDDLGFRDHFRQDDIDILQRLDHDSSNEDAYRVYQKSVKVGYDPTEGILKMEVIAATPEASEAFSEALIGYAEEQVDNLTARLRADQMDGAISNFEDSERKVREAQLKVLELQEELGVLDPASETGSLMQQITQFEVQLRTKQLELQQLQSNSRPSQARIGVVQGEIDRLESLVTGLRQSMTEGRDGAASLARVSGELRIAEADLTTRQVLLQQAAQQLESARIEANRQVRYMAVGVRPVAPDVPTYPRAFENTLLAFVIFAGIYLMVSLTTAVLREQV